MSTKTVLLFIFGATIVSCQFAPKLTLSPSGCPPAPELAPMICKLMQHNIQLQYKPQLIAPSTYIPPLVVEKCDTPQLHINLPLPIEKKPIVIPKPPTLPPITLPKFPVPVIIEKPVQPQVPIVEPCEPAVIPEIPVAPELPEINEPANDFKPVFVPQPPQLPTFVMPELPVRVPEPPMIVEPCPEDQPMQFVPVPEYVQPLMPMPAAPELPPVRLPELPARIEIPSQPMYPPMIIERPVEESGEIVVPRPMAPIPAAPELPPAHLPEFPVHITMPTQPFHPPMFIEQPLEEPCLTEEIVVSKPLAAIPAAPELPPKRIPELPVHVEIPAQPFHPPMFIERPLEEPCLTEEIVVSKPLAAIPAAPELPTKRLPELPVHVEISTQPIHPPMIIERPAEEPCFTEGLIAPHPEPVLIPQPPRVPQFIMPEPLKVEVMNTMPIFPAYPEAAIIGEPCDPDEKTHLPPYFVRHSPSHVAIHSNKFNEYMVPSMVTNRFRPMQNIQLLALPYMRRA